MNVDFALDRIADHAAILKDTLFTVFTLCSVQDGKQLLKNGSTMYEKRPDGWAG